MKAVRLGRVSGGRFTLLLGPRQSVLAPPRSSGPVTPSSPDATRIEVPMSTSQHGCRFHEKVLEDLVGRVS